MVDTPTATAILKAVTEERSLSEADWAIETEELSRAYARIRHRLAKEPMPDNVVPFFRRKR
jgi:hypothetical protein